MAVPEMIRERQSEKITDILNSMIAAGVHFDVAEGELDVLNTERLTQSDIDFLNVNGAAVLCTLQQSLLTKHCFSHSKHRLEDFADEISEREAILTECGKVTFDAHFEAVAMVTRKWFADLLNNKL